jgi:hypothetical protein
MRKSKILILLYTEINRIDDIAYNKLNIIFSQVKEKKLKYNR